MMDHEFMPEDEERIGRLERNDERMRRTVFGDKTEGKQGLIDDVRFIKDELRNIKDLVRGVRFWVIGFAIGAIVAGVIWGIYTIREAASLIK